MIFKIKSIEKAGLYSIKSVFFCIVLSVMIKSLHGFCLNNTHDPFGDLKESVD